MQVLRVFLSIGLKAMLNGTLDREAARERLRQRAVDELNRNLCERAEQPPERTESQRRQRDGTGETRDAVSAREKLRPASEAARNLGFP